MSNIRLFIPKKSSSSDDLTDFYQTFEAKIKASNPHLKKISESTRTEILNNFIKESFKSFPLHLRSFFSFSNEVRNEKLLTENTFRQIFRPNKGMKIEYLDLVCMYTNNTTFFNTFSISSSDDLKMFCVGESFDLIKEFSNLSSLYSYPADIPEKLKIEIKKPDIYKKQPYIKERNFFYKYRLQLSSFSITLFLLACVLLNTINNTKNDCFKYQQTANIIQNKKSLLRILILPFQKGEQKLPKDFECILFDRFKEMSSELSPKLNDIEIILADDSNWNRSHTSSEARTIADSFKADYVIWGECYRKNTENLTEAFFEVKGLWVGQVFQTELKYLNNWSKQVDLTSISFMKDDLNVLVKETSDTADITTNLVKTVYSKKILEHFKFIIHYEFIKRSQYKEAYNILDNIKSLKAYKAQYRILFDDFTLVPTFLKKIEAKLKKDGYSNQFTPLAYQSYLFSYYHQYNMYLQKKGDSNWVKSLNRSNMLADSVQKYMNLYKESISSLDQILLLSTIFKQKAESALLIEQNYQEAISFFEKGNLLLESLPYSFRMVYLDIDFIKKLMNRGYFKKAEEYLIKIIEIRLHQIGYIGNNKHTTNAYWARLKETAIISAYKDLTTINSLFCTEKRLSVFCQAIICFSRYQNILTTEYLNTYKESLPDDIKKSSNITYRINDIILGTKIKNPNSISKNRRAATPQSIIDYIHINKDDINKKIVFLEKKRIQEMQKLNFSMESYLRKLELIK